VGESERLGVNRTMKRKGARLRWNKGLDLIKINK
jgi:hypothetical protein